MHIHVIVLHFVRISLFDSLNSVDFGEYAVNRVCTRRWVVKPNQLELELPGSWGQIRVS